MITSGSSVRQWRVRADPPQQAIVRFVLLSMLLHATIVILFGTSHGGGAGRGEGVLDVLDVTFRRQPSPPEPALQPGLDADTAIGRVRLPRTDQTTVAPARNEPMPTIEPAKTDEATPPPAALPPGRAPPEAVPPMPPPAVEPLPRIDLRAPQEVDKPLLPPLISPPAIERLAPAPDPAPLAPPPDIAPPAIPQVPAAPIERLTAPALRHELAPAIQLAPPSAPVPPAVPIDRLAAPEVPKALAPAVEIPPREAPIAPAPIDHLTVPRIDRELAPAPNLVAPGPSVAAPATPSETAPAQIERTAPPATARPAPAASEGAPPAPDAQSASGTRSAPATPAPPPRLRLGAPGPDEDIFKPRRDVATPGEDGSPRIDLDAARQRAREIASETTSTRGILPALPPPPDRQSKESHALEKAVKPDCRTAYAGLGLLAVPVLVASTIGDAGCRW